MLADCGLAVESMSEDLAVERAVLAELDQPTENVIATGCIVYRYPLGPFKLLDMACP